MEANIDDIKQIRSMMEKSSKFLSLSGMSGVSAGIVALMGALTTYLLINGDISIVDNIILDLSIIAFAVIVIALLLGLYFSARKAKRMGTKLWLPVTQQIIKGFSVPMIVGGLFCVILIFQHTMRLVAPTMLIFYGIALINVGSHTYRDIKLLGVCEIILGLLSGIFVYNGLLFWSIGFGILHIIYGITMYYKYDVKEAKNDLINR